MIISHPPTSEEVVAAACKRASWWAEAIKTSGGRGGSCRTHRCSDLKEIIANTNVTGYIRETDCDSTGLLDHYSLHSHSFFGEGMDVSPLSWI